MKKWLKVLAIVLCLSFVQTPVMDTVVSVTEVQAAAVKNGLKKENNRYYYYVKGKRVKNTWKTIKFKNQKTGKTASYRYYFGSNGAAYQGGTRWGSEWIAVKTIRGAKYGFNKYGRMVKGTVVSGDAFYYFDAKTGKYNSSRTASLRKYSREGADYASLKKLIGNPRRRKKVTGCYGDGQEYQLEYTGFYVSTFVRRGTKKEIVIEVFSK